jgi:hypothetical protein
VKDIRYPEGGRKHMLPTPEEKLFYNCPNPATHIHIDCQTAAQRFLQPLFRF